MLLLIPSEDSIFNGIRVCVLYFLCVYANSFARTYAQRKPALINVWDNKWHHRIGELYFPGNCSLCKLGRWEYLKE